MIQERSILKVTDNSGAKIVRCFRVPGGSRKHYAEIGEVIIASVQSAEPRKQVKKKDIVRALVVRQKKALRRPDGTYVRFDDNAVVLIDKEKKEPKATRIFGPIPREIKERGYETIASLAEELV
jgi:large subunit ribosomal protein L14